MKKIIVCLMIFLVLFGSTPTEIVANEVVDPKIKTIIHAALPYTVPTSLTLDQPAERDMVLGEKIQFDVTNVQDKSRIRWISDNTSVATVSADGLVTAKSFGKAVIIAAYGGMTARCEVTVKLADIVGAKVTRSSNTALKVSWKKVPNASGYVVYRSTSETGTYKAVKTITKGSTVSYTNKKLKNGVIYYYKIRAYKTVSKKKVYGDYTDVIAGIALKAPTFNLTSPNYRTIKVIGKEVKGKTRYEYAIYNTKNGTPISQGPVTHLDFNYSGYDYGIIVGKTYYVKARAYTTIFGVNFYGPYSGLKSTKVTLPKPVIKTKNAATGVDISWPSIYGAQEYEVLRATSAKGKYTTFVTSGTNFVDTTAVSGKTYYYKVRSVRTDDGVKYYSSFSTIKSHLYVARPAAFNHTIENGEIKLDWSKVTGASGYVIERSSNYETTYTTVKTITSGSTVKFTDKTVVYGQTYYYRIRAYKTVKKTKKYSEYYVIGPIVSL